MNRSRQASRLLITLGATAAMFMGGIGVANAAPSQTPGVTTNCGRVTCSDYVSREGTRQMLDLLNSSDNPADLLSDTACTLGGGRRSPVCRVARGAIQFGEFMTRRTLEDAVSRDACFKTTYTRHGGAITWVSTNNGQYCHDA